MTENLPSVNIANASMNELINICEVNRDNISKIKIIDDLDEYLKKFDYCPIGNSMLQNYKITENLTPERSYRDTLVNLHGTIQAIKDYELKDKENELEIKKLNLKINQLIKQIEKETDDDEKAMLGIDIEKIKLKIARMEDARKMSYPVLKDALERGLFFKLRLEQIEKQGLNPDFEEAEKEFHKKKVLSDARAEQISKIYGFSSANIIEMAERYDVDLTKVLPGDAVQYLANLMNPEFKLDPAQDPKMISIANTVIDHVRPGVMVAIAKRADDGIMVTDIKNLFYPFSKKPIFEHVFGENIDVARNKLVQKALLMNAEYIFFIDDDILLQRDDLLKLYEANVDVISGCYFQKHIVPLVPVFQNRRQDGSHYVPNIDGDRIIDLNWMSGMGCMLIKTDALKKIKPPYFTLLRNNQGGIAVGEDCYFIQKCIDAGLSVKLHTGVKAGHVHVDEKTGKKILYSYYEPRVTVFGLTRNEDEQKVFKEINSYSTTYKKYDLFLISDDGEKSKETDITSFNKLVAEAPSELFLYVKNCAKLEKDFILNMVETFRRTFFDRYGVVTDTSNNAILFSKSIYTMLNDNLLNENYESLQYALKEFLIACNTIGRVATCNLTLGDSEKVIENKKDEELLASRNEYLERQFRTKGTFDDYFPKDNK